ncbi:MAG: lamin tail domain-containing protein [Christensenellales bacterium]
MAKRPARKAPARTRAGRSDITLIVVIGLIVIIAAFVYQLNNTDGFRLDVTGAEAEDGAVTEIYGIDDIRLNEVMSANDSAFYTEDGESADYFEIYNTGTRPVSIGGYTVAKSATATNQFIFPDMEVQPGECVLVFCDNKLRNASGYEFHAPFAIGRAGDTLMLFNAQGTAIDSVNIPELANNIAYERIDEQAWESTAAFTPGLPNTAENHQTFQTVMLESPIEISELMAKNITYAPDASGLYHDYIELYNRSNAEVSLAGYHLSDSRNSVMKWAFPAGAKIPAGGYLLVYASGLDKAENGEYHTSFKLSTEGESVVLSNEKGQLLDAIDYGLLKADEAYSKDEYGDFTKTIPPTPGMPNTQESAALISDRFAAQNAIGLYLSEIAASTTEAKYDWVELYNATDAAIDISGFGLSDDAGKPRKWQFPAGTVIEPGGYFGVFLAGRGEGIDNEQYASFRLSAAGGYNLCLSTGEGEIFDRAFLPPQYSNITYGRLPGQYGRFYYFTTSTPLAQNAGAHYVRRAAEATYSVAGGLFDAGETVTVELTAEPGDRIYYTTDYTDPDEGSTLYTGPITIGATTALRTRVYAGDALASNMRTQTYFFGVSHTMRVVSLVSDPANLFSNETGIMVKGPNALPDFPYGSMNRGANFWMDWEREGHIEIYETDGDPLLSQACGVKLHGQYSRAMKQQAFKIYARSRYGGGGTFQAALFDERDYEEYGSFLLRQSGQDGTYTRMRDSVLTSLAENTSVFYQKTELCIVYINGEYWGHYNMREHINARSICQFEGWEGQEDNIDLVKANTNAMRGSNETYAALLEYVNSNNTNTDEAYERIGSVIDIQNYIEYMSVQIFTGNTDTLNVKRYRNAYADGLWRWVLYDLDWAFYEDTNSIRRWLTPGGMGASNRTNNDLFIGCMKNDRFRDEFLTYFGQEMATTFTTASLEVRIMDRYRALEPELEMQLSRWGISQSDHQASMRKFVNYAIDRPAKLLTWFQEALSLSNDEMQHYFGAAYEAVRAYENSAQ